MPEISEPVLLDIRIESVGAAIAWMVDGIDRILGRISPRYMARRFWDDYNRLSIPGDSEWNANVMFILRRDYGLTGRKVSEH